MISVDYITLKKVFYFASPHLTSHWLLDDQRELFVGYALLDTPPKELHPVALASVIYCDQLSRRQAYRRMYGQFQQTASERIACNRIMDIPAAWVRLPVRQR